MTECLGIMLISHTEFQARKKEKRAQHFGANIRLQLLLENSASNKGHNFVKNILRITSPAGMGSPFDSKQLV